MTLADSLVVFAVSLLVGALGIYGGARVVSDYDDFAYAVVTALVGGLVWAVVAFFFGWIPLLGPLLAFVAYVAVLNWRYPGGWIDAVAIALVAWIASFVVLSLLALLELASPEAIGVPGI